MNRFSMLLCAAIMATCGCNPVEKTEKTAPQLPDASSVKPAATEPKRTQTLPSQQPTANIDELRSSYEKAKAAYAKNPSDENKSNYVAATVSYGTAVMMGEDPPRVKYPKALELYDEALALDPSNEEAKTNRQLILDIYKSMGKEPPKGEK